MDRIEEIRKRWAAQFLPSWTIAQQDVNTLLSHISSLEKRVEAQGKALKGIYAYEEHDCRCRYACDCHASALRFMAEDALREVGE